MSIKMFQYFFVLILTILLITSCSQKDVVDDSTGEGRIVREAGKFLYGCPSFFIPPYTGDPLADPTKQNISGAISWTPNPLIGASYDVETKDKYISKLNKATIQNQVNWNQYQQITGSGFPGYEDANKNQHPDQIYQSGFVCYSLVYSAITDAGLDPWDEMFPGSAGALSYNLTEITQYNNAMVGDIVLFDWNNDGTRDHAGIIIEKIGDGASIKDWKIISSLGVVEIFEGGVKETRLGVFGTTNGGEFIYWNTNWNNWTFQVYDVPTN
jgi:cell wall-associated NlpC family hydrolase